MRRSPTDTLIVALEEFGKDEPEEVLVIFTTRGGDICQSSSTDKLSTRLGMLKTIEAFTVKDLLRTREDDRGWHIVLNAGLHLLRNPDCDRNDCAAGKILGEKLKELNS